MTGSETGLIPVQWREAVKTLTSDEHAGSGYGGTALLSSFLSKGSYREEARKLVLSTLGLSFSFEVFRPLFDAAIQATPDAERLPTAINLTKVLFRTYNQGLDEQKNIRGAKPSDDIPSLSVGPGERISLVSAASYGSITRMTKCSNAPS